MTYRGQSVVFPFGAAVGKGRDLFREACLEGSAAQIEKQGSGLCRGYQAITRAMVASGVHDDADAGSHGIRHLLHASPADEVGPAPNGPATAIEVYLNGDRPDRNFETARHRIQIGVIQGTDVLPGSRLIACIHDHLLLPARQDDLSSRHWL